MKNKEIEELLKNCKIWVKTDDIDYTRWFGLYELSLLLSYIEQLEKKVDQYENPEDLTLFYMWLDEKAKDKIKQLEKENERLQQENQQLKKKIDDVVEYIKGLDGDYDLELANCVKYKIFRMLGEIDEQNLQR